LDTLYDPASAAFTLVYQFYPGVPLNELIASITYPQALRTVLAVAHTLAYVHSLGLVHRDIKPANILITPSGARLFDFGLTKALGENEEGLKTNNFGTKCYKSPEVIYRMGAYNQAVDVWCLGLVLAELLLNKRHLLPYETDLLMLSQLASLAALGQDDRSLIPETLGRNVTVNRGKSWSQLAGAKNLDKSLVELVKAMLSINPGKRPSLA
jgi:serine/threonine protein kinase